MDMSTRILSILLVLAILANPLTGWVCYEKGKTKGYSLASKDRATQTYAAKEQKILNSFNYAPKKTFSLFSWGRLHLLCFDGAEVVPTVTQQIIKEQEVKR
jgi:hypothetical protein